MKKIDVTARWSGVTDLRLIGGAVRRVIDKWSRAAVDYGPAWSRANDCVDIPAGVSRTAVQLAQDINKMRIVRLLCADSKALDYLDELIAKVRRCDHVEDGSWSRDVRISNISDEVGCAIWMVVEETMTPAALETVFGIWYAEEYDELLWILERAGSHWERYIALLAGAYLRV